MKTIRYILTAVCAAVMTLGAVESKAQLFPNTYMNVDWQLNAPLSPSFADEISGWGLHFEGGAFLSDHFSLGGFLSYHTNLKSVARTTLPLESGGALTTAQEHTVFQLPFGVAGRWTWRTKSVLQPYVGMKLGAQYAQISSYYYVLKQYDNTWGFYLSPEAGMTIFPCPENRIGIHLALYYSYATNSGRVLTYDADGFGNLGFRVGISF